MTNTSLPQRPARDSAVGSHKPKRSVLDIGMGLLTPCSGRSSWTAAACATRSTGR